MKKNEKMKRLQREKDKNRKTEEKMDKFEISKIYNKKEYSDFQIIGSNNEKLYLHKCILTMIPFFDTYFNTKIGNKKDEMVVDNFEAYNFVLYYIYNNDELDYTYRLDLNMYIDIVKITEMLELKKLKSLLFDYLSLYYKYYLDTNIEIAELLYLFFNDQEFRFPKCNPKIEGWAGQLLTLICTSHIVKYMENNSIPQNILSWNIREEIRIEKLIEIHIRLAKYQELIMDKNIFPSEHFKSIFSEWYDSKSNIFTPKQVSAMRSYNLICEQDFLIIDSFIPFKGRICKKIGIIKKIDNNCKICENSFDVMLISNIDIKNEIQIDNIRYNISRLIYIQTNEYVDLAYSHNLYNIKINTTIISPNLKVGMCIYKIEEL